MSSEFLKELEYQWIKLYQAYDMIDDSFPEYKDIEEKLNALEIVIDMFR